MALNMEDYPDYTVVVRISKTGDYIAGLINNEEISYAGSASIGNSSAVNLIANTASGTAKGAAVAIAQRLGGNWGGQKVGEIADMVQNVYSTFKAYDGGDHAPPPVTFHVFPNAGSYLSALKTLYRLTAPNTEDGIRIKSYLYDLGDLADIDLGKDQGDPFDAGLVHLSIGKWFHATGLFCEAVNFNFSKYVDSSGVPIYMEVTISFATHKSMNAKQLLAWHTK